MISMVIYLSSLAVTLLAESLTIGKSRRALEKISRGFWKAREKEDEEEEEIGGKMDREGASGL